jgi:succinylglutamate desuccinylase
LSQDAYRLQLKLFLYEVKQQQLLSGIRSYLNLYTTITISKLAQYMEVDEATLRSVSSTKLYSSVSKPVVVMYDKPSRTFGQANSDDIQAQNACS